jgi:hypothetical protein
MTDKPDGSGLNRLPPPRRHLVYWSIGALVLVALGTFAVVAGLRIRARTEHRAIFTIRKIVLAASGMIYMEHDMELVGDNLTAGIAKQSGSSVVECVRHVKGSGSAGLLGFRFLPISDYKTSGTWAYGLGDCPHPEMITTPLRIELKPGERYVVLTCRDKPGAKVELYVHCDDL